LDNQLPPFIPELGLVQGTQRPNISLGTTFALLVFCLCVVCCWRGLTPLFLPLVPDSVGGSFLSKNGSSFVFQKRFCRAPSFPRAPSWIFFFQIACLPAPRGVVHDSNNPFMGDYNQKGRPVSNTWSKLKYCNWMSWASSPSSPAR